MLTHGYVQIYTGNGKGKTTAALGLIVRACGAGLRVYIGQFIKKGQYSEIKTLNRRFPEVTIEQYGGGHFIKGKPAPKDIKAAEDGLKKLRHAMLSKKYDVIIADEINGAVAVGLFFADKILCLIDDKPKNIELVLTGRAASDRVIDRADLVPEMNCVKHYFNKGIKSRKGIES